MSFFRSLLAKYMLIIILALVLVQVIIILFSVFAVQFIPSSGEANKDLQQLADEWHADAKAIQPSDKTVNRLFSKWHESYQTASMFWIDDKGNLRSAMNVEEKIPHRWTATITARFLKERYDSDPFTVVAFIGGKKDDGFIVFEIPRKQVKSAQDQFYESFGNLFILGFFFVIAMFILVSFLFFRNIRKRLLHLQEAMEIRDVNQLPIQIEVKKKDEIGQLEKTFNRMVCELETSREREQEEEHLRKQLIANLSHDLRTPLTKLRAHTYTVGKEALSTESSEAVQAMEKSIGQLDRLVDNLLSYTLLTVDKYTCSPEKRDILRFVREQLAAWYPVFEKEGFVIETKLEPFSNKYWEIDPLWMGRILDNVFQNVLRHAKNGKYVSIEMLSEGSFDIIKIKDRGQGDTSGSYERGAGIGLSIVDMMVRGMRLEWDIQTNRRGTVVIIKRERTNSHLIDCS